MVTEHLNFEGGVKSNKYGDLRTTENSFTFTPARSVKALISGKSFLASRLPLLLLFAKTSAFVRSEFSFFIASYKKEAHTVENAMYNDHMIT